MLMLNGDICLVDIQNSLQAPKYYDLVSFLFDSYLNTKEYHSLFFSEPDFNREQFFLTALQRNIKALGSFGYQINVVKNNNYRQYIKKTLSDIKSNPLYSGFL
jgi:aminoglycoside/choline kinase family phosphotransferase